MIGVRMGVKNAVNLLDAVGQALLAEVRRCIDERVESVVLEEDGGAEAFVFRFRGQANRAVAT